MIDTSKDSVPIWRNANPQSKDYDPVTKPQHYCSGGIEPFDFISSNRLDFATGNVIKYVFRHEQKDGIKDLLKAQWYLQQLIKRYENE